MDCHHCVAQAPLVCSVLLILASILLSVGPIVGAPSLGYLFAVGVLVVGAILWFLLVKLKLRIPGFRKH